VAEQAIEPKAFSARLDSRLRPALYELLSGLSPNPPVPSSLGLVWISETPNWPTRTLHASSRIEMAARSLRIADAAWPEISRVAGLGRPWMDRFTGRGNTNLETDRKVGRNTAI
jgi:hypothetical protein